MDTISILIANTDRLEERHILWAAKRGYLLDPRLTDVLGSGSYRPACGMQMDDDDWAAIWAAHQAAGHALPALEWSHGDDQHDGYAWRTTTYTLGALRHEHTLAGGWAFAPTASPQAMAALRCELVRDRIAEDLEQYMAQVIDGNERWCPRCRAHTPHIHDDPDTMCSRCNLI